MMPFNKNKSALESFHTFLNKIPEPSPEQKMVRKGISCLLNNPDGYSCISPDTPFVKEFFDSLEAKDSDDENFFSLLECLAIFIRERSLRLSEKVLSKEEKEILQYFEKSGQWGEDESSIVSSWYWHKLPLRVYKDFRSNS